MKASTKILLSILLIGVIYCFFCILNDHGGSSLGDVFEGIGYTSIVLFFTSLIIIIVKRKELRKYLNTFIFLLMGMPLTIFWVIGISENIYDNRKPDLSIKYPRPVTQNVFLKDSLNAEVAIDSFVVLHNRLYGGLDIKYGVLDTIIYSPSGSEVFIIYAKKFEKNDWGNDLDPDYFFATKRNENKEWELETGLRNITHWGGSYHTIKELKESVRKFYFNEYKFKPIDSLKENYFWKTKNNR